jgi:hypothetical protein
MTYAPPRAVATFGMYNNSWLSRPVCAAHGPHGVPRCLFLAMVPLRLAAMVELPYI